MNKKVNKFRYLRSNNAWLHRDGCRRLDTSWMKELKRVSEILCDKRLPIRLKDKVHRTAERPAILYPIQTVTLKKSNVAMT